MAGYLRRLSPYRRVGGYISGGTASQPGSYPTTTSAVWSLDDLYLRRVGPLLDNYPNAAAAYSLRSLTSAYTGPVVTVRRSSDSAEADFTATEVSDGTLEAWCGAGDGLVKTLYDQSGHGRHGSQSTATAQPKIVSSGVLVLENGLPAMEFDGTNDELSFQGNFLGGIAATSFSVSSFANATRTQREVIFGMQDTSGTRYDFLLCRQASDYAIVPNSIDFYIEGTIDTFTQTVTDTDQRIFVAAYKDSERRELYSNGAKLFSSSVTAVGNLDDGTAFILGGDISSGSNLDGTIQELIIYPVDQSANRVAIEDNINSHYNVF